MLLVPASHRQRQRHSQIDGTCPSWLAPRRLGAIRALTPRGVLPPLCSGHPRIPPVAGNPFRPAGGLRAVIPRLPRLPPSVAACASIENILVSHGDTSPFPSRLRDCSGRGCPRPEDWSGMRGFAPHSKTGRWGDLNPLGRIFFGGSPRPKLCVLGNAHLWRLRQEGTAMPCLCPCPTAQFCFPFRCAQRNKIGVAPGVALCHSIWRYGCKIGRRNRFFKSVQS